MGRTALGTAKVTTAASVTLSSIALNAGDTLLVAVMAYDAAITGVTWNGNAMTLDRNSQQLNTLGCVSIWRYRAAGSATGDIVATPESNSSMVLLAMKHDQITATSPLDKTAEADAASGTSASSGNTATTTTADQFLFGAIGATDVTTDTAPSWGGSFSAGQFDKNTAAGNKVLCAEGYRTVSATGAYSAAATLTNSREWAAAICTYKLDVAQTSTPSSIDVGATANNATGVPGAVSSAPDSVAVAVVVPDPNEVPGAIVATPASVAVAVVVDVTEEAGGGVGRIFGARDPEAVTALEFVTLGPTTPAVLGDGDHSNASKVTATTPGAPPTTGTFGVTGTVMRDLPPIGDALISHLRFRACAWNVEPATYPPPGIGNARMRWTVGVDTDEAVVTNDSGDPFWNPPGGVAIRSDDDGVDSDEPPDVSYYVSTANITTQPNGQPWTVAAVNALVNVELVVDYDHAFPEAGNYDLDVAEIMVEVYGPVGSNAGQIALEQQMGVPRMTQRFTFDIVEG